LGIRRTSQSAQSRRKDTGTIIRQSNPAKESSQRSLDNGIFEIANRSGNIAKYE